MRKPPQETLRENQKLLTRLKADWLRINRPHVSKELRDCLYTRIVELEASNAAIEASLRRGRRGKASAVAAD